MTLTQRKDTFRKMIHNMNEEYEALKNQLQENEMHVEVRSPHGNSFFSFFWLTEEAVITTHHEHRDALSSPSPTIMPMILIARVSSF